MLYLLILCGSPGSGKTTLSKKIAENHNLERISFDENGCLQHKELISPVMEVFKNSKSIVVDALFTCMKHRKMILEAVKDIPCKKVLIVMTTPLEECLKRNSQREGNARLPDFIVEDIYNKFESPTLDEGWDEIVYL